MANFKDLEVTCKALGNKRRLAIIRHVRAKQESSVGDIADDINLSFKSTSRHLAVLTGAEILTKEQRGPQMIYSLHPDIPEVARRVISLI